MNNDIPVIFAVGALVKYKDKPDNTYEVIGYGKMRNYPISAHDICDKWLPSVTYRDIKTHDYYTREREDFLENFASYHSPAINSP